MRGVTQADFDALWPKAPRDLVAGMLATQADVLEHCGIVNDNRLVHFMAQISHESDTGNELVESLNYAEKALRAQWPTHFTADQAAQYGRTTDHPADQRMIGNLAYGGRMGNAPYPSDDGFNYRGRGLLQITGKDSYRVIGNASRLDLLGHPELVVDPMHALAVAATEFQLSGCLPYCDADNLLAVSSLINVGHVTRDSSSVIGYPQREQWLAQWKRRFGM
jgi:putative chitinase